MSDPRTVIVIEDDERISDLVALYLRRDGFAVVQAHDGPDGVRAVWQHRPALVLLDIGLPGDLDGFEVCRQLRGRGDVPVIILTARDDEVDRVLGLELGADDYVTKPFSPRELVARVRAVLRRASGPTPAGGPAADGAGVWELGGLKVDTRRHEVHTADGPVPLTTREYALLAHLLGNQGLVLSRRQLLDGAWGPDWYGDERTVDVHVRQLRRKLGDALPLATVRGAGYRLG